MITDEISIPTTEIEADGFITRQQDLERVSMSKARPASKCPYPHCEDCRDYAGQYCTVPMVVSKQKWLLTEALLVSMEKRLSELENLVTDEILGSREARKPAEETNMTWADYFEEADK